MTDTSAAIVENLKELAMHEGDNPLSQAMYDAAEHIEKLKYLADTAESSACDWVDAKLAGYNKIVAQRDDLYEALENIMITCSDSTINTNELAEDVDRARAALAKANGEAQGTEEK